jgi:4-amino-4-deoxy-L-arabinose transferase-like glycosyltransferase
MTDLAVMAEQSWTRRVRWLVLGAIVLRLVLFLGRGDYIALDEGWYLLLGRSLMNGDGYSLIGIPHLTLSPLFPLTAGAMGALVGDWLWGGRLVAALASGLLVWPAWSIFRRLADARTAFLAAVFVALMPALAPFVAAYWIGTDLWVGAEPLLHLFVYLGVAAWLWASDKDVLARWLLVGGLFALGFLARPESIITWGFLGLLAVLAAVTGRSARRLAGAVAMGVGFLAVAAPYWTYLHSVTGVWSLSGRGVAVGAAVVGAVDPTSRIDRSSAMIEQMLWSGDDAYMRRLYGVDSTGLRMGVDYWGVYPTPTVPAPAKPDTSARSASSEPVDVPPWWLLYAQALGIIVPFWLWPFIGLGLLGGMRRQLVEVTTALVGTSLAIAVVVAVDARTQAFILPLLALFAARGVTELEARLSASPRAREALRPAFFVRTLVVVVLVLMGGTHAWRLGMSLYLGSPHHEVGRQNRLVGEALDTLPGVPKGPVSSFHPSMAVFADRDWRPLAYEPLGAAIRYAGAAGATVMVMSSYYPPTRGQQLFAGRYLVIPVPAGAADATRWQMNVQGTDPIVNTAVLTRGQ